MARLGLRQLLALVTIASAVIIAAPPAHAAGELRVVADGGGPLVDLSRLAPGMTRQSRFSASNTSGDDAALALRVVDLREDDNGCNRAETRHGDNSCGQGGGELGRDLTVAVVPLGVDGSPSGEAVFSGSVRNLVTWTVAAQRLAAGTERSFRLDWELPISSPNDTQTDTVAFDFEFVLEQEVGGGVGGVEPAEATPDIQVAGAQLESDRPTMRVLGTQLPATGVGELFRSVGLGLMALVLGGFLLAMARRQGARATH
jgi:hypothetical protein